MSTKWDRRWFTALYCLTTADPLSQVIAPDEEGADIVGEVEEGTLWGASVGATTKAVAGEAKGYIWLLVTGRTGAWKRVAVAKAHKKGICYRWGWHSEQPPGATNLPAHPVAAVLVERAGW